MFCQSFHFKPHFAGSAEFAVKIPCVMNPDTKGCNARAIFDTSLKMSFSDF